MKKIKIGKNTISRKNKTYFIADIAANHDGSISRAKKLIRLCAKAGADAAKFQHFKAETIISPKGFKSIGKNVTAVLNLSKIQNIIDKSKYHTDKILDLKVLKEKNLINKKFKKLKILGSGEIKKNIEISAHFFSKQALAKIEKAGGKINIVKK